MAINLNGSDTSIFSNRVDVYNQVNAYSIGDGNGQGAIKAYGWGASGASNCIEVRTSGGTVKATLRDNGSATFAGTITSEGRDVITTQTGLWLPTSSLGSVSYNAEKCYWVRNGSLVTLNGNVNDFTQTSDSSAVTLSGYPYPAVAESYGLCSASKAACGSSSNIPVSMAFVLSSSQGGGIQFLGSAPDNSNQATALVYNNLATAPSLYFQITYMTDDTTWVPST